MGNQGRKPVERHSTLTRIVAYEIYEDGREHERVSVDPSSPRTTGLEVFSRAAMRAIEQPLTEVSVRFVTASV